MIISVGLHGWIRNYRPGTGAVRASQKCLSAASPGPTVVQPGRVCCFDDGDGRVACRDGRRGL